GPAETERDAETQRDCQGDLDRRAPQRDGSHGRELAKRQLEPEGEQKERRAELRQLLDVVDVDDREAARERTDNDAGQDVPDNQWLAKALREKTPRERGYQHKREIGDEFHLSVQRTHPFCTTSKLHHGGSTGD